MRQTLGGEVSHFLDRNGLECDAVIHLRNGTSGLVEIKLGGEALIEEGVDTLNALSGIIDASRRRPSAPVLPFCDRVVRGSDMVRGMVMR